MIQEDLRLSIYNSIKTETPVLAAMFLKNWKRYKVSAELFLKIPGVTPQDTILDYGCGVPFVVKILRASGFNVIGYEPYATPEHLQVVKLLGLEEFYTGNLDQHKKFDHILMIDVIEHLAVITPDMEFIYDHLTGNGTLFISTPNVMRFDMWKKFIFRKTGHPTSIQKFLRASDHYNNHQREFTMNELVITCKYFKFDQIVMQKYADTQPTNAQLNAYHQLLNDGLSFKPSLKEKIQNGILFFFPASVKYNNLFVAAKK